METVMSGRKRHRNSGFTLTELLIAVTIIGLISAIAMPLYTQYSIRTYRTEGQSDLLLCAQGMERLAAAAFSYATLVDTDADGTGDASNGAVSANICTPRSTRYNYAVQNVPGNGSTFEILATAIVGSPVATNGALRIDSDGSQLWDKNNDSDFADAGEDNWKDH
ncbi:MAG: prepilin-type N-terminal cleavage/methylation domain-containing protein [Pseudomonadales bacterium]|nr:prepilin-type N-terminal cleavage/methylation domain-containing protein [Pseudomonadales bacterium]